MSAAEPSADGNDTPRRGIAGDQGSRSVEEGKGKTALQSWLGATHCKAVRIMSPLRRDRSIALGSSTMKASAHGSRWLQDERVFYRRLCRLSTATPELLRLRASVMLWRRGRSST